MTTEHSVLLEQTNAAPVTHRSLLADLRKLAGKQSMTGEDTVIVHTSMSRLGWIVGGAQAVVETLLDFTGEHGTLVMPTHSAQLTDPANWENPPVPEAWWPQIRSEFPAFDPDLTPTRLMGAVAETFRKAPGVLRSMHPHGSFAACGPNAALVTGQHDIDCIFGERSPVRRLYDLDALILLLGVDHGNNTCLHLAEYRSNFRHKTWHSEGGPILVDGEQQWLSFEELKLSDTDFPTLGNKFADETRQESRGSAGWGEARLVRCRAIVDYAVRWMAANR